MNIRSNIACALIAAVATLHAGPRGSASYTVPTDTVDAAGKRASSGSYTNDGSAGGITGLSSVASPAETLMAGYIAQLVDGGLTLTAATFSVNETDTLQLSASLELEDGTETAIPATSVVWSVQSGPLTGISAGGVATAGIVFQNTIATVQGTYAGQTASLGLTVVNSLPDNFGTYAGDGIADDWQAQYFGLNNPAASPTLDPDGDGQTNFFEFAAGLDPNSRQSRFLLRVDPVPGQSAQVRLVFSPIVAGRNYTVEFSPSLTAGQWAPLTGAIESDNGSERTVIDTSAAGLRKFYRVKVEKP